MTAQSVESCSRTRAGTRLLRRRSQTKNVSAHSFSVRRARDSRRPQLIELAAASLSETHVHVRSGHDARDATHVVRQQRV
ncbi:MAG: hypothetical protein K0R13_792 [Propionibacteriaceae bacterium]|jgi:hypothetical protein|nr:hypothetical protein [Propionibacteriaceae bacterium]